MATSNSITNGGSFKAPQTPQELYLQSVHGDLHEVIPDKLTCMSQKALATHLSTEDCTVSQAWVSTWLQRHGYRKVVRWQRQAVES